MNIAQRISIDAAAKSYVSKPRKLLIDGAWVNAASGKTFPVYDPSTGEVMVQVAEADAADIDKAVKAARKAFDEGPLAAHEPQRAGTAPLEAVGFDRKACRRVCDARGAR